MMWPDLRSAWRSLASARGFTGVAVITLAMGLALSIAVTAIVNAYLLRALPYPAADRLFSVQYAQPGQREPRQMESLDWASLGDLVQHLIAWDLDAFYLLGGEYPQMTPGAWVTPGFVSAFGLQASRGRVLDASDFQSGRPVVAMISHRLWHARFGGDANVIGRTFTAFMSDRPDESESFEIVGVLPDDFWHVNPYTEIIAPLRAPSYPYIVHLKAGVPAEVAAERVTQLVRGGAGGVPADWRARLIGLQSSYTATVRPLLLAVTAATTLVLLIACANIAVLSLVRTTRRERELALRLALGASRGRVVGLVVLEAVSIGVAATALGLLLCASAFEVVTPLVEQFLERRVPRGVAAISLNPALVAGAALCGLIATTLCALAPMLVAWRQAANPSVASARNAGDSSGRSRLRMVLIGTEVAVSLTLLAGSALMTASAVRMLNVDFGIEPSVTMASVALRQQTYPDEAARAGFYDRLLSQMASMPGGHSAALNDWWPMQQARPRRVEVDEAGGASADPGVMGVSPQYFSTLGITIRDGRAISPQDRVGSERVVVVSATLANRLWPGGRAIGQQLRLAPANARDTARPTMTTYLVVGVAEDVRQGHADENLLDAYTALLQEPGRFAYVFLPARASSIAIPTVAAIVDPQIAVGAPRPLSAIIDQERARPRFLAYLLSAFALFAALLALVGMYGVIAYAVRQREREIAVRMAVGASHGSVTWLFVRQGGVVLAGGVIAGVLGSIGMGRLLSAQLFGVGPSDVRVIAGTALALAACGLVAIWWPARRAAQTDPAAALKAE